MVLRTERANKEKKEKSVKVWKMEEEERSNGKNWIGEDRYTRKSNSRSFVG